MTFLRPALISTILLAVTASAAGLVPASARATSPERAAAAATPVARNTTVAVRAAHYNLGAEAFSVPSFKNAKGAPAPVELTALVRYPANISHGSHPLVLMMPGYWTTCADAKAQHVVDNPKSSQKALTRAYDKLDRWPCASGTPALPSDKGFSYLAHALAAAGDVVVSVSANGANAIDTFDFKGDQAREALITQHLALLRRFVRRDRGALASRLPHALVGHVDLRDVGLLGHSRAGRAVMEYVADRNRRNWPRGVTIKAAVALAPAAPTSATPPRITHTSVAVIAGTCDEVSYPIYPPSYYAGASHSNPQPVYQWVISGANHDFWNTEWSPSSGQVGAYDDATHSAAHPGDCLDVSTSSGSGSSQPTYVPQLNEHKQRRYGKTYLGAFFAQALDGDASNAALLDGTAPLPGVTTKAHNPA